ncbi:hypothetical protein D9Q98_010451 [Chlorella vulgaris]|uniref:Sulfotransferase n=1 Tax=Chlorella vulgaris TaxID=3077 RepID=A0A9D4TRU1_CHLVU|nr:hypothetical protein D9Q98_010451 [Chlorella vulgaris]
MSMAGILLCATTWSHNLAPTQPAPTLSVASPLRLYGSVTKHGPVVGLSQLASLFQAENTTTARLAGQLYYPHSWRTQRLLGRRPEHEGRLCGLMYSDSLKIILVKSAKTAGSSLLAFFKDCKSLGPDDAPLSWRCLTPLNFGNATQVMHVMDVWHEYFVFGFGRNVLTRSISQYHYLTTFMNPECIPSWLEYCQDPYVLGDICEARRDKCCDSVATPVHQYLHVHPQANCLMTQQGKTAVDWIGRVEHFDDDFAELVSILNARPGVPSLPPVQPVKANYNASPCDAHHRKLRWQLRNGTENPCDKMELYQGQHSHCYTSITKFYADDLALLM